MADYEIITNAKSKSPVWAHFGLRRNKVNKIIDSCLLYTVQNSKILLQYVLQYVLQYAQYVLQYIAIHYKPRYPPLVMGDQ